MADELDPLVWSNVSVNDGPLELYDSGVEGEAPYERPAMRRLTWKELYEREQGTTRKLQAFAAFIADLDRCPHGRHQGDICSGERGCDGPSKGNMWMQDIERRDDHDPEHPAAMGIGHDMSGWTYYIRRPPAPGRPPVALRRVTKRPDGTTEVHDRELGER